MKRSIEFSWNPQEFDALLETCRSDDAVHLSIKYLTSKDMRILEAGCGNGRVVKYLFDLGFSNIHGIELNSDAVRQINASFPELKVRTGDLLDMPYEKGYFDVVLSYGVVEHFPDSVLLPLQQMHDILKPGGVAVVTVPSLNKIRQTIARLHLGILHPRNAARAVRALWRPSKRSNARLYYAHPPFGDFFEYRLTPEEFEAVCTRAGFEIVESLPTAHIDGLYHSFGPLLVSYKDWRFTVGRLGRIVNRIFMNHPFLHNHMHACVLRKVRGGDMGRAGA